MGIRRLCRVAVLFALFCLLARAGSARADTAVRMEGGVFAKGDVLWLGQFNMIDAHGSYNGPLSWLVVDPTKAIDGSSGAATLVLRSALQTHIMGFDPISWERTDVRTYLQLLADRRDFLSQSEAALLLPMTTTTDNPLVNDRLFILSNADMTTRGYLPTAADRVLRALTDSSVSVSYWTRDVTSFTTATIIGYINDIGEINYYISGLANFYIRPAACINTGDIALYASPSGKRDGSDGLAPNGTLPTGEYVLTLFDDSRGFSAYYGEPPVAMAAVARASTSGATVTGAGGTVSVNYFGATSGTNEYVSAMVTGGASGTNVLFYGRVRHIGEAEDESGTVSINVPAGLKPGGAYTLRVFSEQFNGSGDGPSRRTDYISQYSDIPLTVTGVASVPDTGDAQTPLLWLGLAAFSAAGLMWLWLARRGRRARG